MRYCPRCGAEYVPGTAECSDCLVPLVDEKPEGPFERAGLVDGPSVEELLCVYQANAVDADMIGALLEGSGIQASVAHSGIGAYPMAVGSLGSGRVMIRAEDEERAREIIEAAGIGDLELEEEEEEEPAETNYLVVGITAAIALGLAIMLFLTNTPNY